MIAAALIVRNEQRHILEWLAYHFAIGIRKFVIYDNESTDDTIGLISSAKQFYDIDIVRWPTFYRRTTQIFAYRDACFRLRTQRDVEWCVFLDVDEYLLSTAGRHLTEFTDECAVADAICLNWAVFGSSGYLEAPPGLLIETFCRRAPLNAPINNPVKSIVRPGAVLDCLNPHFFLVTGQYVNGGRAPFVINASQNGSVGLVGEQEWRVNHYAPKSRQHWLERIKRGQCGQIPVGEDRWLLWDRNDEHDISAEHYYGEATRAEFARISSGAKAARAA